MRALDTGMRGDAVIDRQNHCGTARARLLNDFRTEAITIFEAVRHQILHVAATHAAQRHHRQRGTGRTIGIKVAHHHNATPIQQRLVQQLHGVLNPA